MAISAGGPCHFPATENVEMKVKDCLPTVVPYVGDHPIAIFRYPLLLSDFGANAKAVAEKRTIFFASVFDALNRASGYYKNMGWRLGGYVAKSNGELVFKKDVRRCFSAKDF